MERPQSIRCWTSAGSLVSATKRATCVGWMFVRAAHSLTDAPPASARKEVCHLNRRKGTVSAMSPYGNDERRLLGTTECVDWHLGTQTLASEAFFYQRGGRVVLIGPLIFCVLILAVPMGPHGQGHDYLRDLGSRASSLNGVVHPRCPGASRAPRQASFAVC